MSKPGLSFEDHRAVGAALKCIRRMFSEEVCNKVYPAYAKRSYQSRQLDIIWQRIDNLKSALDDEAHKEHPDKDTRGIYY